MALAMIYVVNLRSFGWTLDLHVPWQSLALAPVLAVSAARLAGVYPAWKMAGASPAEALREE
jgi:putative ABC transport system permease protein